MIRDRAAYDAVLRRLSLACSMLANREGLPKTETMITLSDAFDDLTAYVSMHHNAIAIINGGPRLVTSNVVRLADRRGA